MVHRTTGVLKKRRWFVLTFDFFFKGLIEELGKRLEITTVAGKLVMEGNRARPARKEAVSWRFHKRNSSEVFLF